MVAWVQLVASGQLGSSAPTTALCREFPTDALMANLEERGDAGSRLADFHANCRASYQTLTSCPTDNYQACLGSYAGMIGFDITPNYVDSNPTGIVVSPWCSCRGSGNMEEECEKFLRDFTENPCLRNAIQAFGNGTDVNLSPKNPSFQATQAPRVEKTPSLPDDLSDSTSLGTSIITTCTSVQEQGLKANNSKELSMCFTEPSPARLASSGVTFWCRRLVQYLQALEKEGFPPPLLQASLLFPSAAGPSREASWGIVHPKSLDNFPLALS
ncbi:hypothetical protein CB1_000471021 [Camelus ferus]|nr:hypothetical protein CB1_000471021 [Camelus ferus]